ncbi:unnamed protein product [Sphenostylis stenocarpa]|uniref:Uncharacterized protein n=1 Tax=Sphenostylis stenocarpa TaxID=92480 RepID=A0AA86RZK1_9FABA|nr:unnamed protein product [Sphenostylis stenocarpa]
MGQCQLIAKLCYGHSDGVAASELTPEGRRYRCSAAMQLLQPAEPFPPRRLVRRGLEGPAVGDWFRALPPLWSQWQWRSAQDKGDGEFSGAVGCKGTITSKILRRWIVIMRFLSPFDISFVVPLVIPALVPLSSFSQNDLVVHQDDHAELPTIEAMPYSFSVTSLLDLCLPLTLIGQLLSEKVIKLLNVLLHSLPFAPRPLRSEHYRCLSVSCDEILNTTRLYIDVLA